MPRSQNDVIAPTAAPGPVRGGASQRELGGRGIDQPEADPGDRHRQQRGQRGVGGAEQREPGRLDDQHHPGHGQATVPVHQRTSRRPGHQERERERREAEALPAPGQLGEEQDKQRGQRAVAEARHADQHPRAAGPARQDLRRRPLTDRAIEAGVPPADAGALARQLLLLIEGASVVTTIEGSTAAGDDARRAAAALIRVLPAQRTARGAAKL
jgi:hypothetical protein